MKKISCRRFNSVDHSQSHQQVLLLSPYLTTVFSVLQRIKLKKTSITVLAMHALQSLLLLGLPVAIVGSPALLPRAPTGPFTLYAYGEGIGGVPLFTSGSRSISNGIRLN